MCPAEGDVFHAEGQKHMTKLLVSFRGHASRLILLLVSVLALMNINCAAVTPPPSRLTDVSVVKLTANIFIRFI